MIGVVLALLKGLPYSGAVVLTRKSLDESNFFSAALVITITGNIILWPLALFFTNLRKVDLEGVLFFVIIGILSPGIGRLLYLKGMKSIGSSINACIVATSPMYSSMFAVLLLGEVLSTENWVGISCVIVGVILIERILSKTGRKRIRKEGLAFPLLVSVISAFAFILRKQALNICSEPLFGVAMGYSSAFFVYLLLLTFSSGTRGSILLGNDFRLFWKAGVFTSLEWVLTFYALQYEMISVVTPLFQTGPLFVLFFASLYLKELEHISSKLFISTILIVAGAMLVTIR